MTDQTKRNWHAIEGPNGMCACGVYGGEVKTCGALLAEERAALVALVREASEIMQITYAGNFPAGIESFLVRAHRVLSSEVSQ